MVEANNPTHVDHFRRAKADEILVTSRLASRLLARSALYPGLSELVTDIVSGGDGLGAVPGGPSRRICRPHDRRSVGARCAASTAPRCWRSPATGRSMTNPPADFRLAQGDDAVVVAENLGELRPLELQHE